MTVLNTPTADVWPNLFEKLGLDVTASASAPQAATPSAIPQEGFSSGLMRPCVDGQRTQHLLTLCGTLTRRGFPLGDVIGICRAWNASNRPPLPDEKIVSTCNSIDQRDRANHPDRDRVNLYGSDFDEPLVPLFDLASAAIDDLLMTEPPARRWLLNEFLPQGIVGAVVAPGGTSKSQFLMQLAYAIASGLSLAGHWEVAESGSVLMLCAEDDRDEIHRRLHRIHANQSVPGALTFSKKVSKRLLIRSMVGEDTLLTRKLTNGEVSRTTTLARLGLTAAQIKDLRLIIIDPASRFRGGEENKNEDATRFVEGLEWLRKETGATVLIAHHASKASMNSGEINQTASRGASALTDGVRWQASMTTLSGATKGYGSIADEERHLHVELKLVKTNYTAPQPPVLLRRLDGGYLHVVSDPAGANPQRGSHLAKLIALIRRRFLTARAVEREHCGPGKALDMSQKEVRALIKDAIDRGLLNATPRKPLTLTPLGEQQADDLAGGKPTVSGRGTARQRRVTRKTPVNSTT